MTDQAENGTPPPAPGAEERTLAAYVAALASGEPAPGGGSAAASAAAMAAALGEMVCNLTLGRPAYAAAEPALIDARTRAAALRTRFLTAARDDEAAYGHYIAATGLPNTTEAEKSTRRAAMQAALAGAADVPLGVADGCLALLEALEPVARLGNKHAVSDVTVGALLIEAALRGAAVNVHVNARMMRDRELAADYARRADAAEERGRALAAEVLALTEARGVTRG
jgi:formiminotetrahydrofolate cyclodeaminase